MNDWRENYVICEHVAADEKQGTRHKGFRVCCDPCWEQGFLTAEPLETKTRPDGLCIGRISATR